MILVSFEPYNRDPPLDFWYIHKYWSEIAYALFTMRTSCQLSQWYPTGMRAMCVCRRWLRLITTLAVCLYVNFALNACNLTIPRGRSGFCESARNRFFALSCLGTVNHCWRFTRSHCFHYNSFSSRGSFYSRVFIIGKYIFVGNSACSTLF